MVSLADVNAVTTNTTQPAVFTFTAFAYSGIGSGSKFSFTPGCRAKLLSESTDLTPDDSSGIDVENNDEKSPANVAAPGEADFLFGQTSQQEVVVEDNGNDDEDEVEEHTDQATVPDVSYAPVADMSDMLLTGVQVLKQSLFRDIVGPRDSLRESRARVCRENDGRKDILAAAVRLMMHYIDSHDVSIRDGHDNMKEYDLASNTVTKPRSLGWARRPPWGKQYGAKYMHLYAQEVRELFNRGVADSSKKMGPAQMLEELKRKHPGKYSVPSESEIRTEISVLFGKQEKAGGENEDSTEHTATRKRGRKSKLPVAIQEYLQELASTTNPIKPSAAVAKVREKFGQLIQATDESQVTDDQIKTKFSSLKGSTDFRL